MTEAIIEIKKISSKAMFLDKKHFLNTSPIKTIFDNFDYHVSIEFEVYEEGMASVFLSLESTELFKSLLKFGRENFIGKYFSMIVLNHVETIIDMSYRQDFYDSFSNTCIVFMTNESDQTLFLKEWALIEKLSTPI